MATVAFRDGAPGVNEYVSNHGRDQQRYDARVRVLELLRSEGELSVGELVRRLGLPQPQVSNHLACLRWCGFITARRDGQSVYNSIADGRVVAMLDLSQSLLEDNAEHVAACCRIEEPVS